jgi:hypothetical protein
MAQQPYHPEELIPALFGLFMAFFGGHYFLTFAAIEAYRVFGWKQTIENLRLIHTNYLVVMEASRKDDELDVDGDGIADVKQMSKKKLFTRKLALALKACNPHEVSAAVTGLWTGFMGVVATLRIQFAQTITMGATIGDIFNDVTTKYFLPILQAVCHTLCRCLVVVLAHVCHVVHCNQQHIDNQHRWFQRNTTSGCHSSSRTSAVRVVFRSRGSLPV